MHRRLNYWANARFVGHAWIDDMPAWQIFVSELVVKCLLLVNLAANQLHRFVRMLRGSGRVSQLHNLGTIRLTISCNIVYTLVKWSGLKSEDLWTQHSFIRYNIEVDWSWPAPYVRACRTVLHAWSHTWYLCDAWYFADAGKVVKATFSNMTGSKKIEGTHFQAGTRSIISARVTGSSSIKRHDHHQSFQTKRIWNVAFAVLEERRESRRFNIFTGFRCSFRIPKFFAFFSKNFLIWFDLIFSSIWVQAGCVRVLWWGTRNF